MQRTERHIILKDKNLDHLCFLSKNLYNYTNYLFRQEFLKTGKLLDSYKLVGEMAKTNQIDFKNIFSNQQIVYNVNRNWLSFCRAMKSYSKDPNKFYGKPKLPGFKHKTKGRNVAIFTNQQCPIKNGYIYFPKKSNIQPLKTKIKGKLKQVRIIPQMSCHIIEVVYEKEKIGHNLKDTNFLSIDLGINNLATCITNSTKESLLVNGKP